jgi:carbonic anhydrase
VTELERLLAANERYAAWFGWGKLPAPPARRLAILTCMDTRVQPDQFLGLAIGDAHIIRNAGGRASDDALRSLIVSAQLLGTREFLVIHHTGCGMLGLSNADLQEQLHRERGADASGIDFLPFDDLPQSVRDDVETLRSSPYFPAEITVYGFIYDVRSGRLVQVVPPPAVRHP